MISYQLGKSPNKILAMRKQQRTKEEDLLALGGKRKATHKKEKREEWGGKRQPGEGSVSITARLKRAKQGLSRQGKKTLSESVFTVTTQAAVFL